MKYEIIPVTAFSQNCTIFWCDDTHKAAIIDPGGDVDKITRVIEKEKLTVESIILTHGHLDHVGGVAELLNLYPVDVIGPHIADKFWIDALSQQCEMFGFDLVDGFVPDQWLNEGDIVKIGKQKLDVLHCPGHTPGHIVLYHQQGKLLQVGDVLFKGSIGRTDFPQGNLNDLLDAIHRKLLPLGDDIDFIPGHGPMSTLGNERKNNPHLK